MLYVFYGTNTGTVADRASATLAEIKTQQPELQVFVFEGACTDMAPLDELVEARGLFMDTHVVVLKQPFETAESRDLVLERIPRFAASPNTFIVVEGKLDAAHKKVLEHHAMCAEEHNAGARERDFSGFALSDALGARDRRALWTEYVRAVRGGAGAETLHGTLAWAARGMLLAVRAASPDEAGLKPFVYSKFKRYAHNYTPAELLAVSHELLTLYHEAHQGKHDLATATERWTLSV